MTESHLFDPRRSSARLLVGLVIGSIAWFASAAFGLAWITRALIAGDLAGLALFAMTAWIILRATSDQTRARSAAEDPGRKWVWVIVLIASTFAMFAATVVTHQAASLAHAEASLVLAIVSAMLAWLLTHTVFTLRYAHLYYRAGLDREGGIEFPHAGDETINPDDLDFAYFAFTIGMCFQVSDAQVFDRVIRRTTLAHAVLSFVYNTGIIALVLNVATSHIS